MCGGEKERGREGGRGRGRGGKRKGERERRERERERERERMFVRVPVLHFIIATALQMHHLQPLIAREVLPAHAHVNV